MGRLLDEDMVINALQTTKFRNDLFVDRGYARAISIIKELPTIQQEKAQLSKESTTSDLISRQAAIDIVVFECGKWTGLAKEISKQLKQLPPAQPEPSILLSWVEKYIEWLKSLDNEFAKLAAAHISVMVKKWRDEQDETD